MSVGRAHTHTGKASSIEICRFSSRHGCCAADTGWVTYYEEDLSFLPLLNILLLQLPHNPWRCRPHTQSAHQSAFCFRKRVSVFMHTQWPEIDSALRAAVPFPLPPSPPRTFLFWALAAASNWADVTVEMLMYLNACVQTTSLSITQACSVV